MIEKLLIGLALGVLQFLAGRKDQRNAAQAEVYREAWALAKKAYEWETTAAAAPDGGGDLRVRDGAGTVQLQGLSTGAERVANHTPVHHQRDEHHV